MISGLEIKMMQKVYVVILKILDVCPFLGPHVKILVKMANFDSQRAINGRKSKIFKIAACTFCITLESSLDIKISLSATVSFHIFVVLDHFGT